MEPRTGSRRNWIVIGAIALVVIFLLGFIPQYRNASRLQGELGLRDERIAKFQRGAALSRARELASLLHVELTRKNYGLGEKHATAFFDHVRGMVNDNSFLPSKGELGEVLGQRDAVISSIAKAEPDAQIRAGDIVLRMHQLTAP